MSDDLGKKVEQIAQMLGQGDVPDNIKELVSLFASKLSSGSSDPSEVSTNKSNTEDAEASFYKDTKKEESTEGGTNTPTSIDPELIEAAKKSVERFNSGSDARINLLHAIEPFMSSKRQKKIGSCIQLLQIASISKLLNDREK